MWLNFAMRFSLDPGPIRLQLNAFFNFVLLKKNRPGTEATISLDPRPHFPLGKLGLVSTACACANIPRYLGALDNIVYAQ